MRDITVNYHKFITKKNFVFDDKLENNLENDDKTLKSKILYQ